MIDTSCMFGVEDVEDATRYEKGHEPREVERVNVNLGGAASGALASSALASSACTSNNDTSAPDPAPTCTGAASASSSSATSATSVSSWKKRKEERERQEREKRRSLGQVVVGRRVD